MGKTLACTNPCRRDRKQVPVPFEIRECPDPNTCRTASRRHRIQQAGQSDLSLADKDEIGSVSKTLFRISAGVGAAEGVQTPCSPGTHKTTRQIRLRRHSIRAPSRRPFQVHFGDHAIENCRFVTVAA